MTWQQEWKAIAGRIKGIQNASSPLIAAYAKNDQDATNSSARLLICIGETKGLLQVFAASHKNDKANEARKQTAIYQTGVLGGLELANYRYIVLVSNDQQAKIPDLVEDRVTYRHINIAVSPSTPSEAARK